MRLQIIVIVCSVAVSCVDPTPPETGAVIWRVAGSSAGSPALDNANVYFLTRTHEVVALDKGTGQVKWRKPTGIQSEATEGRTVLVIGSAVIVGDRDIHAFSIATGARMWQFQPTAGYSPGHFDLATDGARVFAGSPSGHVYAVTATGAEAWRVDLNTGGEDLSAFGPIVQDGRVFVCFKRWTWPRTGGLAALDAMTGAELWRVDIPGVPPTNQGGCNAEAAATADAVVAAAEDGHLYAFNAVTGAPIWSAPQLTDAPGNVGNPQMDWRPVAAGSGIVVVGSTTGWVVAYDAATGNEKWRGSPDRGSIIYPIAVGGGSAFTVGASLELTSFDLLTGAIQWIRGHEQEHYTPRPAIDGDRIYIGGPDHISALRR